MKREKEFFTSSKLIEEIKGMRTKHELLNLKSEFNTFTSDAFKAMKNLGIQNKKISGEQINILKIRVEEAFKEAFEEVRRKEIEEILSLEEVDISLPSFNLKSGSIHPVSFAAFELISIMKKYGFNEIKGPEIETNYYNFDSLNIGKDHPAREMHDTFYLDFLDEKSENFLLRTHTSNSQIRGTEGKKPPFAFVSTGRTYRKDFDRTHTPMFNQIECLYVEKGANMGNLMWILNNLFSEFFEGVKTQIRFRPSFFPFTEPSVEVDINIGNGYLEVMGAGMVHPNVLKNCNIDPEVYSGFAFGGGVERIAMLKYGISDLRDFFNSNKRWNEIYGFRI